jgi:hypothetical protein
MGKCGLILIAHGREFLRETLEEVLYYKRKEGLSAQEHGDEIICDILSPHGFSTLREHVFREGYKERIHAGGVDYLELHGEVFSRYIEELLGLFLPEQIFNYARAGTPLYRAIELHVHTPKTRALS